MLCPFVLCPLCLLSIHRSCGNYYYYHYTAVMSPGNSKGVQPLQARLGPVPGGPSSSFSTRTLSFPPGGEAHSQQPPTSLCSPGGCSFYKKAVLRLLPKCPLTHRPASPFPSTVSSPGTCLHRLLRDASEIPALMLPWHQSPCSSVLLLILPLTVDSSPL